MKETKLQRNRRLEKARNKYKLKRSLESEKDKEARLAKRRKAARLVKRRKAADDETEAVFLDRISRLVREKEQMSQVSEIFTSAGKAFNTLGDLILQVQTDKEGSSKWSQEEVDMLKNSVTKFNEDLNQLSSHIKAKQTSQIRQTLKNKSYQQAGLVPKVEPVVKQTITQTPVVIQEQIVFHHQQPIKIEHQLPENLVQQPQQTTSHMTLNRLNAAQEEEMDVSEFQNEVKIETSFSEVS